MQHRQAALYLSGNMPGAARCQLKQKGKRSNNMINIDATGTSVTALSVLAQYIWRDMACWCLTDG